MSALIAAEHLCKRFGGVVVADDIELALAPGDILGLIGPNGAGKTSLFNLLSGLIAPDSGMIRFQGQPIDALPMYRRARLGLSRTWQNVRLFPSLSVLDNLLIAARDYPAEALWRALFRRTAVVAAREESMARAQAALARVGLGRHAASAVGALPYGQQKLVGLARALMNDGPCLLLDEPMAGVEGQVYDTIKQVVRDFAASGRAVCVVEHNVSFIQDLCDRAVFMFNGRIIETGTVDALLRSPTLAQLYFGA